MGDGAGRGVHAAAADGSVAGGGTCVRRGQLAAGGADVAPGSARHRVGGSAYAAGALGAGPCDFGALATAVYAVYDADSGVLTYARRGRSHAAAPPTRMGSDRRVGRRRGPVAGHRRVDLAGGVRRRPAGLLPRPFYRRPDGAARHGPRRAVSTVASYLRRGAGTARAAPRRPPGWPAGPVDLAPDPLVAGMDPTADHDDDVALLVAHVPRWQRRLAALFRSAGVDLVGGTEIAAHARAFTYGVLLSWQVGEDICDAGVLAVSELVANATIHGSPPVRLRLRRTDRRLIMDVSDGDDLLPRRRLARDTDEDGRGIGIVASLASCWGSRQLEVGKSVWCEFSL